MILGNILKLEDRHRQVGLIGMCIGVGEITGKCDQDPVLKIVWLGDLLN